MTEDAKGNKTDGIAMFQRMIEMKLDKEKKRGNEMGKVFEDYFSELQTDMVEICMEYVEDRSEKIYIYCSFEGGGGNPVISFIR